MKFEITRVHTMDAARGGKDIRVAVHRTKYENVQLPMMNDNDFTEFKEFVNNSWAQLVRTNTDIDKNQTYLMPLVTITKNGKSAWVCTHCSALVRFLYNGVLHTAAITHATQKAFRVINMKLGATWIPFHILKFSNTTQQYVVIDETYKFNFTKDISIGFDIFPKTMHPDALCGAPETAEELFPNERLENNG